MWAQYAEAVAPQNDWNYVTLVLNDPDLWPCVGRISYHNYGAADPYRSYLRDCAQSRGLTTAQTEMVDPSFDDLYNDLIVGGKPWAAWLPFCVVGFEGTILVGTLVNFTGLWIHTRLGRWKLPRGYDRRFSADKFAIIVGCPPERTAEVRALLEATKPEETYDFK